MKGIAGGIVMIVAWGLILAGAFLFIDGFLPSRSQGPTPSWVEVVMGTGGLGLGLCFRWLVRWKVGQEEGQ